LPVWPGRGRAAANNADKEVRKVFALARRSPFDLMEQMQQRMEQLLQRFFDGDTRPVTGWVPDAEAQVSDGRLVVRCDLPGVEPADIHVAVRGRSLSISGERKAQQQVSDGDYWMRGIAYGSFERSFSLPDGVDPNAVKATYRNGVLQVEVPLPKELTGTTVPITVEKALTA
jgi:HSP20 family protein